MARKVEQFFRTRWRALLKMRQLGVEVMKKLRDMDLYGTRSSSLINIISFNLRMLQYVYNSV